MKKVEKPVARAPRRPLNGPPRLCPGPPAGLGPGPGPAPGPRGRAGPGRGSPGPAGPGDPKNVRPPGVPPGPRGQPLRRPGGCERVPARSGPQERSLFSADLARTVSRSPGRSGRAGGSSRTSWTGGRIPSQNVLGRPETVLAGVQGLAARAYGAPRSPCRTWLLAPVELGGAHCARPGSGLGVLTKTKTKDLRAAGSDFRAWSAFGPSGTPSRSGPGRELLGPQGLGPTQ